MKKPVYKSIRVYLSLCRFKISLLATASAVTAFILASFRFNIDILFMLVAVLLLASGASALNQYQDRDIDALMGRTRNRALPSGQIYPMNALYFSLLLIISGLFILLLATGYAGAGLGLYAIIWYNGVYTFLKRKSAFAVVPGALTGAIPPAIGWVAGGGAITDPRLFIICFFFFMWQIPHFWLLIVNHGDDYEKAGIPCLSTLFSKSQIKRIIFIWIASTSVSCLFLWASGVVNSPIVGFSLLAVSSGLVWYGFKLLKGENIPYLLIFHKINIYMLFVLTLASLDKLLI